MFQHALVWLPLIVLVLIDRRFSGSELLVEVAHSDGTRLWCEAGLQARRLAVGDHVNLRIKPVETVAFALAGQRTPPTTDGSTAGPAVKPPAASVTARN